jgi:hypothetical protein
MIMSESVRWRGNSVSMGEKRNAYRVLVGTPEGKKSVEDPDENERIILTWILDKQDVVVCTGFV